MKTNKAYRFKDNPKEKEFYDKFTEMFMRDRMANITLSAIICGWRDDSQTYPKEFLTQREEGVCTNLIQWLGSPVGQSFLENCGYTLTNKKK